MRWQPLPIPDPSERDKYRLAVRLNSLGSLFFFEKYTLQREKLSNGFHKSILHRLETGRPRYLIEAPRDHFKSVMVTEGRTMWRSLPFNEADEACMRDLGYGDEWIRWMKETHNPARRTLIVSETLDNAVKLGLRFDWHYLENANFKAAFPEVLPDAKCKWTGESKQQKAPSRGPQGEGTYDFIGVGGALQSRHYSDIVEDDVIGKDALESDSIMEKTHDYHKLLIGAFESYAVAAWTVVNNRWAPNDLSGWIRSHQKDFYIESHSALGGCCPEHPPGVPIFPEEFTLEILEEIRQTQGPYFFSHQYLNLPVNPEECIFKPDWLRFYGATDSPVRTGRKWIHHEVREGEVVKDVDPNTLVRTMVVDPNHAEERGRAHHAILVTGIDPETDRVYLLDVWAKSSSYDDLVHNIFKMAKMWNLPEFWLETNAAQRLLRYPVEYMNKSGFQYEGQHVHWKLSIKELKADRGANAKRTRIESLEPLFRDGRLWVRHDQSEFLNEYYDYPGGRTVDVLDCLGYATQTWNAIHAKQLLSIIRDRKQRWAGGGGRSAVTGY
jgi:hypothetical protein